MAAERPFVEALLRHPGVRLRIAHDEGGRGVGFSTVLPVSRDSVELLASWPSRAPLIRAYWSPEELAALPATAETSNIYYLLEVATTDWQPEAVQAALLRD